MHIAARFRFVLCGACLVLAGCGQQGIHARWFNSDMSLRLHPDGRCVYNSRVTGLVEGVYQYDPKLLSPASSKPVVNLMVYLPGRQMQLSAQLLGSERLHLRDMTPDPGRDDRMPLAVILKRASNETANLNTLDEDAPLASATQPESERQP